MIVIDISCDRGHAFEGWFATAVDFDEQRDAGMLRCPECNSSAVTRLPSAPHLSSRPGNASPPVDSAVAAQQLAAALRALASGATDVGKGFAEEARRIHRGESAARSVRGEATRSEVEELLEEGIPVLPVPSDKDLH